jgi:hypothetical protein
MSYFSAVYYERKRGEKLFTYIIRIERGCTLIFFIIGLPLIILFSYLYNEEPLIDAAVFHGIAAYIGLIIGAPIGLLLRNWFLNRRKQKS